MGGALTVSRCGAGVVRSVGFGSLDGPVQAQTQSASNAKPHVALLMHSA
jgi:hypothetical protein